MSYDYEAKGRADFTSGFKDDRLYANGERHGEDYRRGWQAARREKEMFDDDRFAGFEHAGQTPVAGVEPNLAPEHLSCPAPEIGASSADDCPFAPPVSVFASSNEVAKTDKPKPSLTVKRPDPAVAPSPTPSAQLDLFG